MIKRVFLSFKMVNRSQQERPKRQSGYARGYGGYGYDTSGSGYDGGYFDKSDGYGSSYDTYGSHDSYGYSSYGGGGGGGCGYSCCKKVKATKQNKIISFSIYKCTMFIGLFGNYPTFTGSWISGSGSGWWILLWSQFQW